MKSTAEVAASALSRRAVDDLLAPLDTLGPDRSAEAVTTLGAYLDSRGSLKATAGRLHIHPNTVSYRLRQITEHLKRVMERADPQRSRLLIENNAGMAGCVGARRRWAGCPLRGALRRVRGAAAGDSVRYRRSVRGIHRRCAADDSIGFQIRDL